MKLDIRNVSFTGIISLCRIGMGLYNALSGPTLLYLSENVNVSVAVISTVFSARSIGNLLGAILGGAIKRAVGPDFKHLITLGSGVAILGLMDIAVPWITDFWLLIFDITIGGIMYGYLDAGLQALLLQLWGENASRPYIQLFHLMYSVGAFITPLFATPFLVMADADESADDQCPNTNEENILSTTLTPNITDTTESNMTEYFNPIGWTYIITGVWLVLVAVIMIWLSLCDIEKSVSSSVEEKGLSSEARAEEPISDVIWVFAITTGYYFFCVTVSNIFYNFIYSIALCSGLQFGVEKASYINSVFWLGLGLGRLSGIFASPHFKPRTIIMFCIIGSTADTIVMCLWGETTPWIAWTASLVHGYMTSMMYPSGVSWLQEITNISGTYMFIFNVGNSAGTLTMLPLAGYIFDIDPFSVMYLILGLAISNWIVFSIAIYIGKKHIQFLERTTLKEAGVELPGITGEDRWYENISYEDGEIFKTKL